MAQGKEEYKSIAKANALFGGVQVFKILISIVSSKLTALLLGPEGMGLRSLLQSTIDLVKSATNMGLQTSAVRDVSVAHDSGDKERVATVKETLNRWTWITGMLGLVLTFIFSKQLSEYTFKEPTYSTHLKILSITLLIYQLGSKYQVLLQGTRRTKKLAQSSIIGQVASVVFIIPFYYFWGMKGIVPALVVMALIPTVVSKWACRDIDLPKVKLTLKQTWINGKSMVVMGFMIGLTGLIDALNSYIVQVVIEKCSSHAEVGLYSAGNALVVSYVGLAFSAIATDYYPRITVAANKSVEESDSVMNKQFEILIMVLVPLVMFFVAFGPLLLKLLYSSKFVPVTNMVSWMAVGMLLRAFSWCPAFLFLSKNDPKLYLGTYLIQMVLHLSLYIAFYYLWGLTGLGVAFVANYICYIAIIIISVKKRYGNSYTLQNWKYLGVAMLACGAILGFSYMESNIKYAFYLLVMIPSFIICFKELNARLDILTVIKSRLHKQ